MKSLKRTLCLVLALVMVLGLFGIASATNFTDDNDIQYKEAVEVVTGIGAINGMGDGTFAPKATITRAQAAKLVTYVALSKGVAETLTGVASSFTDVTVDGGFGWAIPSIEYLVKEGAINGMGDGTFNPNGEITGIATLKLLLCALGYGKMDEYVGDGWDLQVLIDANRAGLTAGIAKGTDPANPATREELALYCFNALGATMVDYDRVKDKYEPDGSATYDPTGKATGETLGDAVYSLNAVDKGVVTANGATNMTFKEKGKTGVTPIANSATEAEYVITTGLDLIGHYVKVYYKTDAATSAKVAYAIVDAGKVVNVPANITADVAYKAAFGALDVDSNDDAIAIAANSTVTDADFDTFSGLTAGSAANKGTYVLVTNTTTGKDEIVSYIKPAEYTTSAVTSYVAPTSTTEGKLEIAGVSAITVPKVGETDEAKLAAYALYNIYEAPAKDDIVMIQSTGAFTTITKANIVGMGKISEVNTAATPNTFVSNGTTYTIGSFIDSSIVALSGGKLNNVAATLAGNGNTYAFLADAQGKIVAIATVDSSADKGIVYPVQAYQELSSTAYGISVYLTKVQCVDMNGEQVVYTVGASNEAGLSGTALASTNQFTTVNDLCYNKVDSNGDYAAQASSSSLCKVTSVYNETLKMDIATLTAVTSAGTTLTAAATEGSSDNKSGKIVASAKNLYFDDNTKFIFVKDSGVELETTALAGNQVIPGNAKYTCYATLSAADATTGTVNYVVVNGTPVAAPVTTGVMYVKGGFGVTDAVEYTTASGRTATAYRNYAFVDGEKTAVIMTSANNTDIKDTANNNIAEGFYKFTVDAQGLYSLTPYTTAAPVTVKAASANLFVSSVFTSGSKQVLSTGTIKSDGSGYENTNLDDADMTGIKIVDVLYETATAAQKPYMTNHNTLDLIKDGKVAYTYTTTADGDSINGVIYYIGSAKMLSVNIATLPADALVLNSDGDGWETATTAGATAGKLTAAATASDGASSLTITYTWSIVSTTSTDASSAAGQIATGTTDNTTLAAATTSAAGKITGAGSYVIKCVVSAAGYLSGENTITLTITQAD